MRILTNFSAQLKSLGLWPRTISSDMRTFSEFFAHLKSLEFYPRTIIDVGVASQTQTLYDAFPEAYIVLIEPLVEFESAMRTILKSRQGEYHLCALSDCDRVEKFFVNPKQLEGSTLCYDNISEGDPRLRTLPIRTLDSLFPAPTFQEPVLVKTDVQGQDLNVMRGGRRFLEHVDVVILEVPMFGPWGGGDEFTDYVRVMNDFGFVAYDAIGYLKRPYDQALSHLDIAFVKREGKFRAYKLFQ